MQEVPRGLQAVKGSELRSQRGPAPPEDACQPQAGVWISFYAQRFHFGKLFVYLIFVSFFEKYNFYTERYTKH